MTRKKSEKLTLIIHLINHQAKSAFDSSMVRQKNKCKTKTPVYRQRIIRSYAPKESPNRNQNASYDNRLANWFRERFVAKTKITIRFGLQSMKIIMCSRRWSETWTIFRSTRGSITCGLRILYVPLYRKCNSSKCNTEFILGQCFRTTQNKNYRKLRQNEDGESQNDLNRTNSSTLLLLCWMSSGIKRKTERKI